MFLTKLNSYVHGMTILRKVRQNNKRTGTLVKLKLRNPQVPARCDAEIQISYTLTSTQQQFDDDDDYDNAS